MSQFGDYEDLCETLEAELARRVKDGKGLSVDADHILKSFGMMKGMDFVFDAFDPKCSEYSKDMIKKYPTLAKYMNILNPYNN